MRGAACPRGGGRHGRAAPERRREAREGAPATGEKGGDEKGREQGSRSGGGRLAGGLRRRPSRGGWEVEALAGAEAGGLLERRAARSRAMEAGGLLEAFAGGPRAVDGRWRLSPERRRAACWSGGRLAVARWRGGGGAVLCRAG